MEPIIKGLLSGLAYGLLLGPLFIINIRISISHGMKQGIALVFGAFISDLMLVMGSWWGASKLAAIANSGIFQGWFGLLSGLILLGFGLSALWPRKREIKDVEEEKPTHPKRYHGILQGFIVNMTNPSNWLFWLGVAAAANAEAVGQGEGYSRMFMAAALCGLFITDLSKAILAYQIGRRLNPSVLGRVVQLAGLILIGVGIWVIFGAIKHTFLS